MNAGTPRWEELRVLAEAAIEGRLTCEQQACLEGLVLTDPDARRFYVQYVHQHASLRWSSAKPSLVFTPAQAEPLRARRRSWWPAGLAAALLIGAVAGALVRGTYLGQRTGRPTNMEQSQAAFGHGDVAVLTRVVNVEWEMPEAPSLGSGLIPGRLKLKQGLAQLEFYSGATVILEGPADFELVATDRGYCHYGKLRAKLSPQSCGFTIGTAAVDLVDLGTEFGMQVDPNGGSEVQVFDGKVQLYRKEAGQTGVRQEVSGGQGMRIDPAGTLQSIVPRPEAFIGVAELERRSMTASQHRYRDWQAASRRLQTDPRVVLYYNFEGQQRSDRTVRQQGLHGRGSLDGAIVGCQWIEGRWPGKGALEFKRSGDRVRLQVPGTYDSLTWMAWLRIDGMEHTYTALLLTDGFDEGAPHWQLNAGKVLLGVADSSKFRNFYSPIVLGPDRLGQWIHLATVYDHRARSATHYVNGQPVGSTLSIVDNSVFGEPRPPKSVGSRSYVPLRLGSTEIGNWGVPRTGDRRPHRSFNGRIDELALFGQALDADEILRLYESGKPDS
jgi:hypothetical protein